LRSLNNLATHDYLLNFHHPLIQLAKPNCTKMATSTFDVQAVRSQFPALAHDQVYFDNVSNIAYEAPENL
jgi:hypothetical protein